MAISKVVGLSSAVLAIGFFCAKRLGMPVVSSLLLHASLVEFLVSIASHPSVNFPWILGKNTHGRLPLWSGILFGPFLIFARVYLLVKRSIRAKRREPMYTEILEGLYVGGWTSSSELFLPGLPAVIDCTCEFPRSSSFLKNDYLCIPTWDTRSPSPSEIEYAVHWACKRRAENKPIYVHCANGHGRSVGIMCALLVSLGVAEDWKKAESIVREKRPFIQLNAYQRKCLEEWSKRHVSPLENRNSPMNSKEDKKGD